MTWMMLPEPVQPILPRETRKRLHDLLWTEVHYSDLGMAVSCEAKLGTELYIRSKDELRKGTTSQSRIPANPYMLLGSVFHLAIERLEEIDANNLGGQPWMWMQLFREVMTKPRRRPSDYYHNGVMLKPDDKVIVEWSAMLAIKDTWGISAIDLARRVVKNLKDNGWDIVEIEYRLTYVDGGKYPIVWDGLIDIVAVRNGEIGIFDVKTSGMWTAFLNVRTNNPKRGLLKKSFWDTVSIKMHSQLRQYSYFFTRITGKPVAYYGLIFPVNLIPYTRKYKDKNAGDDRGPGIQYARLEDPRWGEVYIKDVSERVTRMALHGFVRNYPTDWGKPTCPSCQYFKHCVGSLTAKVDKSLDLLLDQYR